MPPSYGFSAKTLIDNGRISFAKLDIIRKWYEKEKLPYMCDEQKVIFLLSSDLDIEATQRTIISYFQCKKKGPEIFLGRNTDHSDVIQVTKVTMVSVLPVRTANNDAILFCKLKDTTYYRFHLEHTIKVITMASELPLYENPPDGLITIIDCKGFGLLHLTRLRLGILKNFLLYIQEGYPCKLKEIHVLNTVYFIDKVMQFIRPLISQQLYNMIKFHSPHMNMKQFFDDCIPQECMPAEYGGSLPTLKTLSDDTFNCLKGLKRFYQEEEEQINSYKG